MRKLAAGVQTKRANLRLHRRDRRQTDAEFVHAEADQDRHARGSLAMPPQTPTHRPAAWAPSPSARSACSTPGLRPSTCGASFGWPRSIASVYCVRSFVPMEKKSASRGELCGHDRRRGTSTMMPAGIGGTPSAAASSARIAFASRNSLQRGDHREHDAAPAPDAAGARGSRGAGCAGSRDDRAPTLMPRSPRNGLSSFGIGR